jgi:uncharacterized protein
MRDSEAKGMLAFEAITELSQKIVQAFEPDQIILFGSYAYGTPHADSDVDLLVVMPYEGHPSYKAIEILNATNPPFAIDLLVRTPDELQQRLHLNDYFLQNIMAKGRVLYAATNP